jgi:hypothetical protein
MRRIVNYIFPLTLALLTACQTAPPRPAATPECPEVKPIECPVCEVVECPLAQPPVVETIVAPAPAPQPAPAPDPAPVNSTGPTVIGAVEWALVEPSSLVMEARIDTGAETSSIHAEDIRLVEKDGKRYVQFSLLDRETGEQIPVERRLHRRIVVKQNTEGAPEDRRYVVRMWVTIGESRIWLDVSLSDRDDFEYELLIGRNMLMDEFIVDVSKQHTQSKKKLLQPET